MAVDAGHRDDELVTLAEAARVVGIRNVHTLHHRFRGEFPDPVVQSGRVRLWRLGDVREWYDAWLGADHPQGPPRGSQRT